MTRESIDLSISAIAGLLGLEEFHDYELSHDVGRVQYLGYDLQGKQHELVVGAYAKEENRFVLPEEAEQEAIDHEVTHFECMRNGAIMSTESLGLYERVLDEVIAYVSPWVKNGADRKHLEEEHQVWSSDYLKKRAWRWERLMRSVPRRHLESEIGEIKGRISHIRGNQSFYELFGRHLDMESRFAKTGVHEGRAKRIEWFLADVDVSGIDVDMAGIIAFRQLIMGLSQRTARLFYLVNPYEPKEYMARLKGAIESKASAADVFWELQLQLLSAYGSGIQAATANK